jgi:hypothetical protein
MIKKKQSEQPEKMKIHSAADVLPMLPAEELKELADNIKANGLLHPIIVDDKDQIVDGRNRLAACRMAKVKPKFEKLNGRDPRDYIISANLARRNLTKGQQAMVVAMLYPEPEKGGRGKKSEARNRPETGQFSKQRLSDARTILRHSRKVAESVMKGYITLDKALEVINKGAGGKGSKSGRHKPPQPPENEIDYQLICLRASFEDFLANCSDERLEQLFVGMFHRLAKQLKLETAEYVCRKIITLLVVERNQAHTQGTPKMFELDSMIPAHLEPTNVDA